MTISFKIRTDNFTFHYVHPFPPCYVFLISSSSLQDYVLSCYCQTIPKVTLIFSLTYLHCQTQNCGRRNLLDKDPRSDGNASQMLRSWQKSLILWEESFQNHGLNHLVCCLPVFTRQTHLASCVALSLLIPVRAAFCGWSATVLMQHIYFVV